MKKELIVVLLLFALTIAVAEPCQLDVSLLNQDPYPAVQGDYVNLVFQINGIANSNCKVVDFELLEKYPIHFDAGQKNVFSINSGTYTSSNYQSFFMPTYKVRVSNNALDGANHIEVRYSYGSGSVQTKEFDLEVEDVRAEFELFISDYNPDTEEVTLEILNIGSHDIEALTLEIPVQNGFRVIGSTVNNVGDLDSNEDTSADFQVNAESGIYRVLIKYSDANGKRRTIEKEFELDKKQFPSATSGVGIGTWIFWIILIGLVGWFGWKKFKKKKK